MSGIPTQAELQSLLGLTFSLAAHAQVPVGDPESFADTPLLPSVEARLAAVHEGIAMDDDYQCYTATFDLTQSVQLPQDLYRVTSPDGEAWDLLITPTRPRADGVATMCAVFHVVHQAVAART